MTQFVSDDEGPFEDLDSIGPGLPTVIVIGLIATVAVPFILGVTCRLWYGLFMFGWTVFH